MANWAWGNRKHWELAWRRWHLGRHCAGAPCFLSPTERHPIRAWRARG